MADLTACHGFLHIRCNATCLRKDTERLVPDIKSKLTNRCWRLVFYNDLISAVVMKHNTFSNVSIILKVAKLF
ncbi:MAG: hypothetical protein ACK5M3_03985 [Dysgonomonas sp.]